MDNGVIGGIHTTTMVAVQPGCGVERGRSISKVDRVREKREKERLITIQFGTMEY